MQAVTGRLPKHWRIEVSNPDLFEVGVDDNVQFDGKPSVLISSKNAAYSDSLFLRQSVDGNLWYGKRVRISCVLKCEDVSAYALMTVYVQNPSGQQVVFDPMVDRSLNGTNDWLRVSSVIDVPQDGRWITFGPRLWGAGKMWAADFNFEEVSAEVDRTDDDGTSSCQYPDAPRNLNFESDDGENSDPLACWSQNGPKYEISVKKNAYNGHNVATLECTDKSYPDERVGHTDESSAYICQNFKAKPFRNSRIKFSASIKTEGIRDEATMVLMINGVNQSRLALSRITSLVGDCDWAEHSCVLDVSNFAYSISIWLQMSGPGKSSFAKVGVEKVGDDVPTTDGNHHPQNLDFRL